MTRNQHLLVANACYAIVGGMFAEFLNPRLFPNNDGRWKSFREQAVNRCQYQLFCTISPPASKKTYNEMLKYANIYGHEIATTFASRAGQIWSDL